jgi:hypothetical protein
MGGSAMSMEPVVVEARTAVLPILPQNRRAEVRLYSYHSWASSLSEGRFVCSDCRTTSENGYRP